MIAGAPGERGTDGRWESPPTRIFGPRPPLRPAAPPPRPVGRRRVAAVAALLLLLPPAVAVLVFRHRDAAVADPAHGTAAPAPMLVTEDPQRVCDGHHIPPAAGAMLLTGDLHGTGCVSWVRYRDGVIEVAQQRDAPLRFRLGRPGDQLLLGDWDCNGTQTAGLYRPASGEIFRFNAWASAAAPLTSESGEITGLPGGVARVVADGDCDRITVTPASNTAI